ncbi:MAG: hypothetical protein EAZ81_13710, partial [Verrucomicrobia bacterium]
FDNAFPRRSIHLLLPQPLMPTSLTFITVRMTEHIRHRAKRAFYFTHRNDTLKKKSKRSKRIGLRHLIKVKPAITPAKQDVQKALIF